MSTRKDNLVREDESLYASANASVINIDSSREDSLLTLNDSVVPLDNASYDNTFLAGGDTNMNRRPKQSYKTPMRGGVANDSKEFIGHEMVTSTPAQPARTNATAPNSNSSNNSNSKRKRADSPDSGRDDDAFVFIPDEAEYSQDEVTEGSTQKPLRSDSVRSDSVRSPSEGSSEKTDDTIVDRSATVLSDKTESGADKAASPELGVYDEHTGIHLPLTVTLLTTPEGARVYVVGTAHFSRESQEDVAKMIQLVKPQIVCVELCKTRTNILSLDEKTILEEAKNINFEKIRMSVHQMGVVNGLMYILLLNMSAHLTKELGMAPGGEFRRAIQEVKQLGNNCVVHLSDRPLNVTIQRALRSLTWWQTLKLSWHLVVNKEPISKEEVERCKQRDLLEQMLKEMAGEFPQLGAVFVQERDIFLTHSLQLAATSTALEKQDRRDPRGRRGGHQPRAGHHGQLGPRDQRGHPPLMHIPPPSRSSVLVKMAAKASVLGLVVWAVARFVPRPDVGRFVRMR